MEQATFALVVAGVMGLLVATPLLAVVTVLVKMLSKMRLSKGEALGAESNSRSQLTRNCLGG
jgi:predicted PurR-regulated permease PerM